MRIIAVAALGVAMLGSRVEARGRYELRAVKVERIQRGGTGFDLSLWDRARKRVLWKRRVDREPGATWSRDRRALAVDILDSDWRVLVWREGYRLREFSIPRGNDYPMGCAWSPSNRRLLLRLGGSGSSTVDLGSLYCLKLGRWPHYKYFELPFEGEGVRPFGWRSRKVAWFQAVDIDSIKGHTLRPRRLWRAP